MKAAVMRAIGEPLRIEDIQVDGPGLRGAERQAGQSPEQRAQDDARLEPREPRAQAEMHPRREGEMALGLSAHV